MTFGIVRGGMSSSYGFYSCTRLLQRLGSTTDMNSFRSRAVCCVGFASPSSIFSVETVSVPIKLLLVLTNQLSLFFLRTFLICMCFILSSHFLDIFFKAASTSAIRLALIASSFSRSSSSSYRSCSFSCFSAVCF